VQAAARSLELQRTVALAIGDDGADLDAVGLNQVPRTGIEAEDRNLKRSLFARGERSVTHHETTPACTAFRRFEGGVGHDVVGNCPP
jgi:hypothetical protein